MECPNGGIVLDAWSKDPLIDLSPGDMARRIMGGDKTAADEFVRRYYRWLLLIVRHKFPRQRFHLDVVQEAFLKVLAALESGSVRNPDAVLSFLRSTAINIGYEQLREDKKHESAIGHDFVVELIADVQYDMPEAVMWQERIERLVACIESLNVKRDRELLRRFYLDNEDKRTVCRALQLTPVHFDRVLYRAKQRLRKCLIEEEPTTDPTADEDLGDEDGKWTDQKAGTPPVRTKKEV